MIKRCSGMTRVLRVMKKKLRQYRTRKRPGRPRVITQVPHVAILGLNGYGYARIRLTKRSKNLLSVQKLLKILVNRVIRQTRATLLFAKFRNVRKVGDLIILRITFVMFTMGSKNPSPSPHTTHALKLRRSYYASTRLQILSCLTSLRNVRSVDPISR